MANNLISFEIILISITIKLIYEAWFYTGMLDSPTDWIIFIVVALVILGGSRKIPELAKSFGRAMGEFRKGRMEVEKEINDAMKTENKAENS